MRCCQSATLIQDLWYWIKQVLGLWIKTYGIGLSKYLDYGLRPMGLDYGLWISWIKARNAVFNKNM